MIPGIAIFVATGGDPETVETVNVNVRMFIFAAAILSAGIFNNFVSIIITSESIGAVIDASFDIFAWSAAVANVSAGRDESLRCFNIGGANDGFLIGINGTV